MNGWFDTAERWSRTSALLLAASVAACGGSSGGTSSDATQDSGVGLHDGAAGDDASVLADAAAHDAAADAKAAPSDAGSEATAALDAGGDAATALDAGGDAAAPVDAGGDLDATSTSEAGDAGPTGPEAGAGACGATTCRGGQTCSGGACVYAACSGLKVPGDYATVQGAVDALESSGGTICLGPQAFNEAVTIDTLESNLTLSGVSASQTSLASLTVTVGYYNGDSPTDNPLTLTLQGIALKSASFDMGGPGFTAVVDVVNCSTPSLGLTAGPPSGTLHASISASQITALDLTSETNADGPATFTVDLDGDDLTSVGAEVLGGTSTLNMQNCFVHGGATGLMTIGAGGTTQGTLANNTFTGNQTAFDGSGGSFALYNNLFDSNQLAISGMVTGGEDALWDNTTNYANQAVPGPGYVTTDPLLDTSVTPPGLLPGSPCRGAGDATHAPATDYWGRPRGASVDIGAVQSQ